MANPLFKKNNSGKKPDFVDLPKSAGILDDHSVRKSTQNQETYTQKLNVGNILIQETPSGYLDIGGNIVGDIFSGTGLSVIKTYSSGSIFAFPNTSNFTLSGTTSGTLWGLNLIVGNSSSGLMDSVYGLRFLYTNTGTGSTSDLNLVSSQITHSGSGTISNAKGINSSVYASGSGNVTTMSGVYQFLGTGGASGSATIGSLYGTYQSLGIFAGNTSNITSIYGTRLVGFRDGGASGHITNFYGTYLDLGQCAFSANNQVRVQVYLPALPSVGAYTGCTNVQVYSAGNNGYFLYQTGTSDSVLGGVLQTGGYKSSDGSTGWTGTFTNGDGDTVTVKNGLITDVS